MDSSLSIGIVREEKAEKMIIALPEISEDLLIEILIRLPVKSLLRFKCISKLWVSLISSRHLTNLFLKISPRSRFSAYLLDRENQNKYLLLTSSKHYHSDTSFSIRIDQDLTMPTIRGGYFVGAVRGLVCFGNGRRVRICNFNTRQVVELPIIEGNYNDKYMWSFFGYEPVRDEYKVVTTIWEFKAKSGEEEERVVRSEHHILSLGSGASWKKIQNHIPHRPIRPFLNGVTINSVFYYGALTDAKRCVIISFDVGSEEFKLIELPNNVHISSSLSCIDLMNYKGKVAVFRYTPIVSNGTVEVWVLEEDKSQWSEKKIFVLPISQMKFSQGDRLMIGGSGISCSGQIWLSLGTILQTQPVCLYIYDLERNEIARRIEIRPLLDSFNMTKLLVLTFWDDIQSIMYLET